MVQVVRPTFPFAGGTVLLKPVEALLYDLPCPEPVCDQLVHRLTVRAAARIDLQRDRTAVRITPGLGLSAMPAGHAVAALYVAPMVGSACQQIGVSYCQHSLVGLDPEILPLVLARKTPPQKVEAGQDETEGTVAE